MKLSEVHQNLLETTAKGIYAKGYIVPEGEEDYFHIMFVDIIKGKGKRATERAVFQKYFPSEWQRMKAVIESPVYTILATGHDEYAIVHDPAEAKKKAEALADKKAAEGKAAEEKKEAEGNATKDQAEVKSEQKQKPGPKPNAPQKS